MIPDAQVRRLQNPHANARVEELIMEGADSRDHVVSHLDMVDITLILYRELQAK